MNTKAPPDTSGGAFVSAEHILNDGVTVIINRRGRQHSPASVRSGIGGSHVPPWVRWGTLRCATVWPGARALTELDHACQPASPGRSLTCAWNVWPERRVRRRSLAATRRRFQRRQSHGSNASHGRRPDLCQRYVGAHSAHRRGSRSSSAKMHGSAAWRSTDGQSAM
jgi:hypothetical protein